MEEACLQQGSISCRGRRVNEVLFRCDLKLSGKRIVLVQDCGGLAKGCQDGGKLASDFC